MDTLSIWALIISGAAFLFSVASFFFTFYWQYWRSAKLKVYKPRRYCLLNDYPQTDIQIIFDFYNDGSKPILIQDLKLVFPKGLRSPLSFRFIVGKIGYTNDRKDKTPFTIEHRGQLQLVCEFIGQQDGPEALELLELQAKLGNNKSWTKKMCCFSLSECEEYKIEPQIF
jgi:hypothetical protein